MNRQTLYGRLVDTLNCLKLLKACPPTIAQIHAAGAYMLTGVSPAALTSHEPFVPRSLDTSIAAIETLLTDFDQVVK